MGRVQRVVFLLGAAQQVEFLETRNLVQMAVPLHPNALELDLLALTMQKRFMAINIFPSAAFQ